VNNQRIIWIDIARGIAILLMLWGHNSHDYFTHGLYSFHMPLFVFLSGFVFSQKKSIYDCIQNSAKRLYLPYICYFAIDFILNWLYELFFYSNHPVIPHFWRNSYEIFLPMYGTGTVHGLWFLIALAWIILLSQTLLSAKIKPSHFVYICGGISAASIILSHVTPTAPFFINQSLMLAVFFALGYLYKIHINIVTLKIRYKMTIILLCMAIITYFTSHFQQIDYYKQIFPANVFACIFVGIAGIAGIIFLSQILAYSKLLSGFLASLGRITLLLLGLHGAAYRYLTPILKLFLPQETLLFNFFRFALTVILVCLTSKVIMSICRKYQINTLSLCLGLK